MPRFLEKKLKKEYGKDSKIPYMIMNKMGAMRGNKETAKGMAMDKKHKKDMEKDMGKHHSGKGTRARLNTVASKMFFGKKK